MFGWLQKVTTTKCRGNEEVTKMSYMVRKKENILGVCRLYVAENRYVPENILGKVQVETSYCEGKHVSHIWQWEKGNE